MTFDVVLVESRSMMTKNNCEFNIFTSGVIYVLIYTAKGGLILLLGNIQMIYDEILDDDNYIPKNSLKYCQDLTSHFCRNPHDILHFYGMLRVQ